MCHLCNIVGVQVKTAEKDGGRLTSSVVLRQKDVRYIRKRRLEDGTFEEGEFHEGQLVRLESIPPPPKAPRAKRARTGPRADERPGACAAGSQRRRTTQKTTTAASQLLSSDDDEASTDDAASEGEDELNGGLVSDGDDAGGGGSGDNGRSATLPKKPATKRNNSNSNESSIKSNSSHSNNSNDAETKSTHRSATTTWPLSHALMPNGEQLSDMSDQELVQRWKNLRRDYSEIRACSQLAAQRTAENSKGKIVSVALKNFIIQCQTRNHSGMQQSNCYNASHYCHCCRSM